MEDFYMNIKRHLLTALAVLMMVPAAVFAGEQTVSVKIDATTAKVADENGNGKLVKKTAKILGITAAAILVYLGLRKLPCLQPQYNLIVGNMTTGQKIKLAKNHAAYAFWNNIPVQNQQRIQQHFIKTLLQQILLIG